MTTQTDGVLFMHRKVYLALYKGRADKFSYRFYDAVTRFFTRGQYSHCEIAVHIHNNIYHCYSSSIRDGGVRRKSMMLDDKWDLIKLDIDESQIRQFYGATEGSGYDLWGALGVVAGLRQHPHKYFCSEWCFEAITNKQDGWRFSPNDLYAIKSILTRRH